MRKALPGISAAFGDFGVRMFALGLDIVIVSMLISAFANFALGMPQIDNGVFQVTMVTLVPAYFVAGWISPLRATPAQFLFGLRVVDESGGRLEPARAVLRAIVVMSVVAVIMIAFWTPHSRLLTAAQLAGFAMVFLAAVTPNRQALHDFLAKSIVVNRKALSNESRRAELLAHVADRDPATGWQRLPSIFRMLVDGVVLVLPAMFIVTATTAAIDKNMRSRVAYAVSMTRSLQVAVEEYYFMQEAWPDAATELLADKTGRYPEGGYYRLEDEGRIRIRFEVKPQLKVGSVLLDPQVAAEEIEWKCRTEGGLEHRYMPAGCRN